jgi:hypothetical protein
LHEYHVYIETFNANTDAWHIADERLYEGAIFRVYKPDTHINGTPVIVYKIDSHPEGETPGIAHARTEDARSFAPSSLGCSGRPCFV